MKYMFPRQFALHNVFTSVVNRRETRQPLQDYTYREREIAQKMRPAHPPGGVAHIPRRLRGRLVELVQRMQQLHARCSYLELLNYYCPADVGLLYR